MVKAFTRGPCEVVAEKGGSFSLFDGNVHGKFLELVCRPTFSVCLLTFFKIYICELSFISLEHCFQLFAIRYTCLQSCYYFAGIFKKVGYEMALQILAC